ncbi:stress induced DNA binding protein [Lactobacillus selangorensis]|uniref:Stress induced DNA binding protein n=1 Tax=Lactobacillus selangorensis TaxID=81857 RepID=A0A0R2G672_9LACO|nr:ferritin-like domain-containing protein [Lactobacillus selangorensis]KRN28874.1 stress induced DNA binding protein [Lactobacillus selangorensis]KRN32716.1 stress induced DNA binding protein [Lactobacillus selangorensis]
MTKDIEAIYQAELKQADIDHHTPTAGAMTGHIVANLVVLANKLQQAKWYVNGPSSFELRAQFDTLRQEAVQQRDELGQLLIAENQVAPTTTAEVTEYALLEEDGRNKYRTADWWVDEFVHDFDKENMFITRAIKLAAKEDRPALGQFLTTLLGTNNQHIAELQAWLGKTPRAGLDDEDDD